VEKLSDTAQTTSYTDTIGEDADYNYLQPSFVDNGDGSISDQVTELMWQKAVGSEALTWQQAKDYCDELELAGYSDWWLPGVWEAMGLFNLEERVPAFAVFIPASSDEANWLMDERRDSPDYAWIIKISSFPRLGARNSHRTMN